MSPADESTMDETAWVGKNAAKLDKKVRAEGERLRAEFVARAQLRPPQMVLRLIDIEATCQARQVILRGYTELLDEMHASSSILSCESSIFDYSAISHTFGMEVYSIFDCECASTLSATANVPPRCQRDKPCPHFKGNNEAQYNVRNRVVNDILEMCDILRRAGVRYAWHDGVCIAQYDEEELTATIKSIGWVYSAAKETIVFLHYVGKPMAPIAPRGCGYDLACRWHTRVWTLQEAALSKSRRYCIRVCKSSLQFKQLSRSCGTLVKEFEKKAQKFEQKVSRWYDSSISEIDVITEERFLEVIYEALEPLADLWNAVRTFKAMTDENRITQNNEMVSQQQQLAACVESWYACIQIWFQCLEDLRDTINRTCLRFPELGAALTQCSRRDSKHVGDRINSVLTLAGLKDLVAPKDFDGKRGDSMEAWTLKFFQEQGQRGLAWAALSGNEGLAEREDLDKITHSWVPLLWRPLSGPQVDGVECNESWGIRFRVCEGGKLELQGELLCVAVTLKLRLKEDDDDTYIQDLYEKAQGNGTIQEDHLADDQQLQVDPLFEGEGPEWSDDQSIEYEVADEEQAGDDQLAYAGAGEYLYNQEMNSNHIGEEEMIGNNTLSSNGSYSINEGVNRGAMIGAGLDNENQRTAMDILSISTDGSHGFAVKLPEAEAWDILGMATFFPLQVVEDGRVIGGQHLKEGESLHACLVAPLHYDWIVSSVQPGFLITDLAADSHDHNNHTASKIGILKALKTKAHDFLRSVHLPSRTINQLIIN